MIGDRLTHIRGSMSQRAFAEALGVPLKTYQTYEQGRREPDLRTLEAIWDRGFDLHWLLFGEKQEGLEPLRYMGGAVHEERAAYQSQAVSDEALTIALELADKVLGDGYLPRPRYARLVRLIYDGITQGLPVAEVLRFGERAGQALQKGDEVDVGESKLGRASRAATG
ncbi:helix-turn-helix transcriptional regulator [Xanthomonas sp. CFBP 8445]|uniref:helix-turn-helix domain-containing protein n=1 Tax=Xanthomonas sp. CFBP 8445 TaxID=2971236 RepID=UPI0021E0C157|nr:helix-turn-helix transcriptional regulator [Xanthomonas sp. CFBP 8445]UYC12252.1 helix-turn-helix transcriptional regulator [Xanthomonas sp. CFBP 8445]